MKALFLTDVAASTAAGIESELPAGLEYDVIPDPIDHARLAALAPQIDILVSNHWRADYPVAPKLRLVQSVATGTELFDLAALGAVDIMQPDLAICGGITEAMRISAIASAHNLKLAPHLWAGAPAFAAGLAVAAASPAGFIVEYSLGANPLLHDLVEESFPVSDGMIEVPDRPGLGITVREDFLQKHAVKP